MRTKLRWLLLAIWALSLLSLFPLSSLAQTDSGIVYVMKVKGTINPVLERYFSRGISACEERNAQACIVQLDTPGGLDSSMRDIIQTIQSSTVPVVVFVSPAGARAASAGVFITMAAHVAAMAPNTAIGAAHPVALGPSGQTQELPSAMETKVINDAVAYIRGIADLRGRNADWGEQAVRESVSDTEQDALKANVIDLIATDVNDLVRQLDGRQVKLLNNTVVIHAQGAEVRPLNMTMTESFLFTISNPNIAFILLSLAVLGLFLELANPGAILPGVVGGILLVLALFSLGSLPVNWAGLLLVLLALAMFVTEVFVTSHGILAAGGIVALVVGGLVLMSGNAPGFKVSLWVILMMAVILGGMVLLVLRAVLRSQRRQPVTGKEGLVGKAAVVRTPLDPEGVVFLDGERWQATSEDGKIDSGENVQVTKIEGMRLWVKRPEKKG